jgi:two-component system sensor histidine kinase/response regulator
MRRKPLILCVDDTSSVLEGRQTLLEENGYKILTATDGKDAVQVFASNPVDLVLLDYHMPQMDSGVAAMHMRACKADVPIALLSGDERLPPRAFDAVDTFISESEPVTSLLEKVDYLLSLRFLFQPLDGSWADEVGAQRKYKVPG